MVLGFAESVIVVPGYGLAVAQAQHDLAELASLAGGAPGHGKVRGAPGGGAHAGPYERAAGGGQRAVRPAVRFG